MGQRSQIFINVEHHLVDCKGKNYVTKYLVARYYQWNYGTRMISRAKGIIEWLLNDPQYVYFPENKIKLERVCDVNWDYHDIVLSQNILEEYSNGYYKNPFEMFTSQDNNDGQLYIDLFVETKGDETKTVLKYCFADYDFQYLGSASKYMNWNAGRKWKAEDYLKSEVNYTTNNISYIAKHAKLMNEDEFKKFIHRNYSSYDFVSKKKEGKK